MNVIHTIDVAHPPRHPDLIEEDIIEAFSRVRNSSGIRVLKIIHGQGSGGRGCVAKEVVQNWLYRNKAQYRTYIEGENYSVFNTGVLQMRQEVGQFPDSDLEKSNRGITIVWIK